MDILATERPALAAAPAAPGAGAGDDAPTEVAAATPEQLAAQAEADALAAAAAAAEQEAAEREAQLQRLLERMHKHADFPSLKDSIRGIQRVARSDTAHMRALTDEILGDVALSSKLLRMINTAFYSSVGAGSIASLQRAVALMGFLPVGMLATSLTLFERLPKGPDGARVRQEFSRALMAAMLANQFCPLRRLEESAYIVAMFQNLGTMLAWMHFPPEAAEVESLMAERDDGASEHAARQAASREVLGMGYDDLAIEVARQWGWPEQLQTDLRPLEPRDPESAATPTDYLRVVATAANRLATELERADSPEATEQCLADFTLRYGVPLGLTEEALLEMVTRARNQWQDLSLVLGFAKQQAASKPAAKGQGPADGKPGQRPAAQRDAANAAAPSATAPVAAAGEAKRRSAPPVRRSDPAVAAALSTALDTLSRHAMSEAPLNDVMQLVMNQLLETLRLQRVVICLREAADGGLVGRFGVGDKAARLAPLFRVPMQPPADLFGLLCSKDADTLISDATDPIIAQRLPAWFRERVRAQCFLLLPLSIGGKVIGMIYGDQADAHSVQVNDNELTLLKALRNQLIMAMRLRGFSG